MELPLDDLEEDATVVRKGPPPLPGQRLESAESTTPTEIPPPPVKPSRPPARLGKSVMPPAPDPKTFKMKSPAEVKTARQRDSSIKETRRLKFKPGDLPFEEKPKPSTRPSAPPPPSAAALRLSSKPPVTSKASKPPPLKSSKPVAPPVVAAPVAPAPAPIASKPSSIRTAVTRPGAASTTSVTEAAKVARIRFLEEELRDVKSRIADHTRRITARLDALAARVEKLEGTQSRATLIDQRVDEMGEDVEERLEALEKRIETLAKEPADAPTDGPTREMVAPPPPLEELEANLLETLQAKLEATIDARIAALAEAAPLSPKSPKSTKKSPKKKKDADPLTAVKGIGPASAKKLRKRGVETPAAVAAWTDDDIEKLHTILGVAKKRLRDWRTAAAKL